jgi:hypothetical protein
MSTVSVDERVASGPTLTSTWEAIAGHGVTDELLEWPPDVFALTNVVLDQSESFGRTRTVVRGEGISIEFPQGVATAHMAAITPKPGGARELAACGLRADAAFGGRDGNQACRCLLLGRERRPFKERRRLMCRLTYFRLAIANLSPGILKGSCTPLPA